MVLDPIPQCLPVHIFGSRPQPPTSPHAKYVIESKHTYQWVLSHMRMGHKTHVNESCHTKQLWIWRLRQSSFLSPDSIKNLTKKSPAQYPTQNLSKRTLIYTQRALSFVIRAVQFAIHLAGGIIDAGDPPAHLAIINISPKEPYTHESSPIFRNSSCAFRESFCRRYSRC